MAFGMRSLRMILLAAVLLLATLSAAKSWIFYSDDRIPSHSKMIGRIEFDLPEGKSSGTAFLVDECGIMTNFHVVFGPWYVTALRLPSFAMTGKFTLTEVTLADGSSPSAIAIPVAWGDYTGPDRQLRRVDQDWTYLALDHCLGEVYGYFRMSDPEREELAPGAGDVAAAGYSSGQQKLDPSCSLMASPEAAGRGGIGHDCTLLVGDSGGPIFKRGTQWVLGIGTSYITHSGSKPCSASETPLLPGWTPPCANIAVALSAEIIDRVAATGTAYRIQVKLNQLGFDTGTTGDVGGTKLTVAIKAAERDLGMRATGLPTCGLEAVLYILKPST